MKDLLSLATKMKEFPGFISFRFDNHSKEKELHIRLEQFLESFKLYETGKHDGEYVKLSVNLYGIKILALKERDGSSPCEDTGL